jgi:hypothetical protein
LPFTLWFKGGWLLALAGAGVFLLIDYASPPVADNVLNSIAIVIALEIVMVFL